MNALTIIFNHSLPLKLRTFLTNDYVILGLEAVGYNVDLPKDLPTDWAGTGKSVSKLFVY